MATACAITVTPSYARIGRTKSVSKLLQVPRPLKIVCGLTEKDKRDRHKRMNRLEKEQVLLMERIRNWPDDVLEKTLESARKNLDKICESYKRRNLPVQVMSNREFHFLRFGPSGRWFREKDPYSKAHALFHQIKAVKRERDIEKGIAPDISNREHRAWNRSLLLDPESRHRIDGYRTSNFSLLYYAGEDLRFSDEVR